MLSKICTKCNIEKTLDCFYKHIKSKNGIRTYCKDCSKTYNKQNRTWLYEKEKEYWAKNPEKYKEKDKRKRIKRKDKIALYIKNRLKTDLNYRLKMTLRKRLCKAIKDGNKVGSFIQDLGCSIVELRAYLESKFQLNMTWETYGIKGWHIDHIKPLSSFNLENREEFLEACNYKNLQPLWAIDNYKKGSKI